jgi:hypothetical protein
MSSDPYLRSNLKSVEMLNNQANGSGVLNFNAGFFGGTSALAQEPVQLKDSFGHLLSQQHTWQNVNKVGPVAGGFDLVNYSELYHPNSFHNEVTGLQSQL